jgi:phosphohistidine phosphatase SixA
LDEFYAMIAKCRLRLILIPVLVAALALGGCGPDETARPQVRETASVPAPAPSAQEASPEGSELLQSLRSGGFVIYFRHAATVPGGDADLQNLANCSAQRNLSDQGREQSREIGNAFRELAIPVGTVLSSALCRTLDTANLAFGRAEQSVDLTSLPQAGSEAEEERRVMALRGLLKTEPPSGLNTVLVGHLFNIQRAADISIAEGEAAVFDPRGEGDYALMATVSPQEWLMLDEPPG